MGLLKMNEDQEALGGWMVPHLHFREVGESPIHISGRPESSTTIFQASPAWEDQRVLCLHFGLSRANRKMDC